MIVNVRYTQIISGIKAN